VRAELAAGIRDGRIDPVELVEESLWRIEAHYRIALAVRLVAA
jgi:hypothetical protein